MVAIPKYLQPDHRTQPPVVVGSSFRLATTLDGLEAQSSALAEEAQRLRMAQQGYTVTRATHQRLLELDGEQQVVWDAIRKEKARLRYRLRGAPLGYRLANGLPMDEASA